MNKVLVPLILALLITTKVSATSYVPPDDPERKEKAIQVYLAAYPTSELIEEALRYVAAVISHDEHQRMTQRLRSRSSLHRVQEARIKALKQSFTANEIYDMCATSGNKRDVERQRQVVAVGEIVAAFLAAAHEPATAEEQPARKP